MTTTVYLIRHAQAEGNLYRRCQGWHNGLITPRGMQQIAALERRFQDITVHAAYSSDLLRTITTAQAVCRTRGLQLQTDPQLREVGCGIWEDETWGELLHRDREGLLSFLRCEPGWSVPGSETFSQVRTRLQSAIARIAAAHEGKTVAVFSHGSAIRSAVSGWLGLPLSQVGQFPLGDNTSVAKIEFTAGSPPQVVYYNDNSHLGDLAYVPYRSNGSSRDATAEMEAHSVHFRPLSFPRDNDFYLSSRQDGWIASHGTMAGFTGDDFLAVAQHNSSFSPDSVLAACISGVPVGILQMDWQQEAELGVGRIPFFYIAPEHRSQGLGGQLLGQAVSVFRKQDRQSIRLRCAPENLRARAFYDRFGFRKIGEEPGGVGHLDTLELYIGFNRQQQNEQPE